MNNRLARGENHSQTQGIHMFTKKMLAKQNKTHQYVNDSGAQRENHCQPQGIHRFTKKM